MRADIILILAVFFGIALGLAASGILPLWVSIPAFVALVSLVLYSAIQAWRENQ